jgi:acetyltransferase-like isoleucine patch superfamily enzyme
MQPGLTNKLLRAPDWLRGRLRIAALRLGGAHVGERCFIRNIDIACDPWDIWIGDHVGLDNHVVLCLNGPSRAGPKIVIHEGTYINRYTVIDAFDRIEIGRGCLIGPHCYIGDHVRARKTGMQLAAGPLEGTQISIGDEVYLGAGSAIMKGVTIGARATVGAGSVVTRDVPEDATVAGVPARGIEPPPLRSVTSFATS